MSDDFDKKKVSELCALIKDDEESIAKRTRLLWYIRELPSEREEDIVEVLSSGFESKSELLKHECAYVLGQMGYTRAIPILTKVLSNMNEDSMVRHEAGEALGAIGDASALDILKKYLNDPVREVRETVELAIQNIEHSLKTKSQSKGEEFKSVDPAPSFSLKGLSIDELGKRYLNRELSLFERYRPMFALRDRINSRKLSFEDDEKAIKYLCDGFAKEEGALFKHEVAFVLGQLQRPETASVLTKILKDTTEHAMVRHEAAEALGSISDPKTLELLKKYQTDSSNPVRESCVVAVDMLDYFSNFKSVSSESN